MKYLYISFFSIGADGYSLTNDDEKSSIEKGLLFLKEEYLKDNDDVDIQICFNQKTLKNLNCSIEDINLYITRVLPSNHFSILEYIPSDIDGKDDKMTFDVYFTFLKEIIDKNLLDYDEIIFNGKSGTPQWKNALSSLACFYEKVKILQFENKNINNNLSFKEWSVNFDDYFYANKKIPEDFLSLYEENDFKEKYSNIDKYKAKKRNSNSYLTLDKNEKINNALDCFDYEYADALTKNNTDIKKLLNISYLYGVGDSAYDNEDNLLASLIFYHKRNYRLSLVYLNHFVNPTNDHLTENNDISESSANINAKRKLKSTRGKIDHSTKEISKEVMDSFFKKHLKLNHILLLNEKHKSIKTTLNIKEKAKNPSVENKSRDCMISFLGFNDPISFYQDGPALNVFRQLSINNNIGYIYFILTKNQIAAMNSNPGFIDYLEKTFKKINSKVIIEYLKYDDLQEIEKFPYLQDLNEEVYSFNDAFEKIKTYIEEEISWRFNKIYLNISSGMPDLKMALSLMEFIFSNAYCYESQDFYRPKDNNKPQIEKTVKDTSKPLNVETSYKGYKLINLQTSINKSLEQYNYTSLLFYANKSNDLYLIENAKKLFDLSRNNLLSNKVFNFINDVTKRNHYQAFIKKSEGYFTDILTEVLKKCKQIYSNNELLKIINYKDGSLYFEPKDYDKVISNNQDIKDKIKNILHRYNPYKVRKDLTNSTSFLVFINQSTEDDDLKRAVEYIYNVWMIRNYYEHLEEDSFKTIEYFLISEKYISSKDFQNFKNYFIENIDALCEPISKKAIHHIDKLCEFADIDLESISKQYEEIINDLFEYNNKANY